MKNICDIAVFAAGALGYSMAELVFRGYTHWSMSLTGGACALTLYNLYWIFQKAPFMLKALMGAFVITFYEFFVGVTVNLIFSWGVWDYSHKTGNILGQICPTYSFIWFCVCAVALLFTDMVKKS